jgi:predicted ATPase
VSVVKTQRTEVLEPVAAICPHVEGLPLAIELVAAWERARGVEQILERLGNVFGLLVVDSPLAPGGHQTMRALDWSYGLLQEPERALFRRSPVLSAA